MPWVCGTRVSIGAAEWDAGHPGSYWNCLFSQENEQAWAHKEVLVWLTRSQTFLQGCQAEDTGKPTTQLVSLLYTHTALISLKSPAL